MADSKLIIILTAVVVITLILGLLITVCYSQRLANKSSTSTFDAESLISREQGMLKPVMVPDDD